MSGERRAYVNNSNPCCEKSAGGWFCTLVAGHAGDHSAGGTRDEDGMCVVFDTWTNGPDEGDKIAAAVSAARADVLAKVEAQFEDFAGEVARTCGGPNAETMPTDRAVVRSLLGRLRALIADLGGTDD